MRELISHRFTVDGKEQVILLKDHLRDVARYCSSVIQSVDLNLVFSLEDILLAGFITGVCHDFGKAKRQFQDYIWGEKSRVEDQHHSAVSSIFTFLVAADVFGSRAQPVKLIPFVCAYTVNRHHAMLTNLEEAFSAEELEREFETARKSLDERIWKFKFTLPELNVSLDFQKYRNKFLDIPVESISKSVQKFASILRDEAGKPNALDSWLPDLYFVLLLLISVLTGGDQASVISAPIYAMPKKIDSETVRKYAFSQSKASPLFQNLREEAWDNIVDFISKGPPGASRLTLPTGMGKTLMGLYLGGELQKDTLGLIVYALPYLSIIEQTTDVFKCIPWDPSNICVVQHHSLSFPQRKSEKETPNFEQARFSLENWDADVIVTTFDQLFYSFLSTDRGFIRRFPRLPSSVLILDEVQTLPARLIPAVEAFLQKMREKLKLQILYMTATHPPFLKNAHPILQNDQRYFESLKRTELRLCTQHVTPFTEYLKSLPEWLKQRKGKNVLFVANTIRSSLQLFDHLSALKKQDDDLQNVQLFYLSGNVVPIQRIQRINEIKRSITSQPCPWVVVVSTQCVEAGVNIDMDEIVRDFAPWDCLMQICGRANRFGTKGRATVWIHRWLDDLHGKEFYRYIYDSLLTDATLHVLEGRDSVKEEEYLGIQKLYAEELEQRFSKELSRELVSTALSWQFNELNFRNLFRGVDAWKTSLFCIADDTAGELKEVATLLWGIKKPKTALEYFKELCDNSNLFSPLAKFLRTEPQEMKRFTEELQKKDERYIRYQLPRLLNPMLQAYTISIPIRTLEGLGGIDLISEGFPYVRPEYYDPLRGFSLSDEAFGNII